MKPLRLASFGLRGFVGESLTPRAVIDFSSAFATFVEGRRVLLGRDTRYSSPMLHSAVTAGLVSAGCEVLDFGVCPTPLLQFSVPRYAAAGAVSIGGGHNAMGWNALGLIGSDGAFLEPVGGEAVLDVFHAADFRRCAWNEMGEVKEVEDYASDYFAALAEHVDTDRIRGAHLIALIDPLGGAGCRFLESFARQLGIAVLPINGEPSGYLAREAEPRPRSALQMASMIAHVKGDVGFVLSSDMGRMSLVTEEGEPASEEYTFAVIAQHVLGKTSGPIVTNCCTTRTVDDIAAAHDAPVVRTRVGQAYVVSRLADEQGVLGGEGSGSAVLPAFSPAFDGFLMMALVLEAMAERRVRLSELVSELPRYHVVKRQVTCGSREGYRAMQWLEHKWQGEYDGTLDRTDGVRMDFEDGWLHARVSMTEQMVRVISEARDRDVAVDRAEKTIRFLEQEL